MTTTATTDSTTWFQRPPFNTPSSKTPKLHALAAVYGETTPDNSRARAVWRAECGYAYRKPAHVTDITTTTKPHTTHSYVELCGKCSRKVANRVVAEGRRGNDRNQ